MPNRRDTALKSLAGSLGHPIYWAGPKKRYTYELNRNPNGNLIIRYLPPGVRIGAKGQYLSVATYPYTNALAGIQQVAKQKGQRTITLSGGGLAVYDPKNPNDVHLAFRGSNYQVEVYNPTGKTPQLVSSGQITVIR